MADPLSPIISQLANLVTVKSCLRLLLICCCIILCWVFIQPKLLPLTLPSELTVTLITIIGFSIGALFASVLFSITDSIFKIIDCTLKKRNEQIKKYSDELARNLEKEEKLNIFKKSLEDYPQPAKKILLELTIKDSAITESNFSTDPHNKAFLGLLSNKTILPLNRIDKSTVFCTINPIYKDYLKNYFESIHRSDVENLFSNKHILGLNLLLKRFTDTANDENYVFSIDDIVYSERYLYSPVIQFEEYEEGEFIDNCNIQFYITEHHYEYFSERFSDDIREYVLGYYNEKSELED